MANVQIEKGYTKIANEIFENIVKLPLNATQWRILAVLWRNTYGYSRKQYGISESYIAKATGISKRYISSELKKLIDHNIIKVIKESSFTTPKTLGFNKDFDTWGYGSILLQVNNSSTVEQKQDTTAEQSFISTVEQSFHQQRNILNKNIKKEHDDFFNSLWQLYPNKKGKDRIKDAKKKELYKIGYEQMECAIKRYIHYVEHRRATDFPGLNYQNGSTFFTSGYVDYLDENYQTPAAQNYDDVKM